MPVIREVDLLGFLPPYLQEYRELQALTATENPEIQTLEDETEVVKDNQYITTCNEIGIARFETLLSITPGEQDTLELRIFRVLSQWNNCTPYTYRVLIEKLNAMLGEGTYTLSPEFSHYVLGLEVHLAERWQIEELLNFLTWFLPANLLLHPANSLTTELSPAVTKLCPLVGGVFATTTLSTLSSNRQALGDLP